MPGYTLINRGIDSFQLGDLIHNADRLIVLHVGGNDVHNGKPREDIWVADRE